MTSRAYVALTVFIALVLPLVMGFMLPSSGEDKTGYTVDNPLNITSSLENSQYGDDVYSTSYLNNLFAFTSTGQYWLDADKTQVHNNYPAIKQQEGQTGSVSGTSTLNLAQICANHSPTPYCLIITGSTSCVLSIDGLEVESLIYYPKTKITYGFNSDGVGYHGASSTVTVAPADGYLTGTYYRNFYIQDTVDGQVGSPLGYLDPSNGFIANGPTTWANSFTNGAVPIIIKPADLTYPNTVYPDEYFTVLEAYGQILYMNLANDVITVKLGSDVKTLGSIDAYPYCMILVEKDGFTISGLMNMDKFTDFSLNKIGASVEFDVVLNDTITMLTIAPNNTTGPIQSNGMRYYVPYVMGGSSVKTPAIEDNTLNCKSYYPDDTWSVRLYSLTRSGTTLDIQVVKHDNTTLTYSYPVSDNAITITVGEEEHLIPLSRLTVSIMPADDPNIYNIFIGDYLIETIDDGKPDNLLLTFNGTWKMNVGLSKVVVNDFVQYFWTAGNFGLDGTGFCGMGLVASFFAFIGLGVYARQQGDNILPLLIASLACGGFYMAMLMS